MGKLVDLTGRKYGNLTVIGISGKDKAGHTLWNCKCSCGKDVVVSGTHLKSGHTKSCGCLIKKKSKEVHFIDLTGKRFGRLVAISNTSKDKFGGWKWLCKCDCGKEKEIRGVSLISGNTRSCGCFAKEIAKERVKERKSYKKIEDLTGRKFGRLTVIKMDNHIKGERVKWICQCECGNIKIVSQSRLKRGEVTHCGCDNPFSYRKQYPRLYSIWSDMKDRCNNPNNSRYDDYGGRGIAICKEWNENFQTFAEWALENGYEEELTIDRIDVNGNYEPSNCRWVTRFKQMSNMRKNVNITYKGETDILASWCRRLNLKYSTVSYRLKNGWSVEEAFEIPPQ